MQVTGGRVSYGRTVSPAQYESKRSDVELSFTLAEGEQLGESLRQASELVRAEVHRVLGIEGRTAAAAPQRPR